MSIIAVGVDLAKSVFAHVIDGNAEAALVKFIALKYVALVVEHTGAARLHRAASREKSGRA